MGILFRRVDRFLTIRESRMATLSKILESGEILTKTIAWDIWARTTEGFRRKTISSSPMGLVGATKAWIDSISSGREISTIKIFGIRWTPLTTSILISDSTRRLSPQITTNNLSRLLTKVEGGIDPNSARCQARIKLLSMR